MTANNTPAERMDPYKLYRQALHGKPEKGPLMFYGTYCTIIPGLLQTRSYSRSLMAHNYSGTELDRQLDARKRYGELLIGSAAIRTEVFIDQSALHIIRGDPRITHEALSKVASAIMSQEQTGTNTTIGILPFDNPDIRRPTSWYALRSFGASPIEVTEIDNGTPLDPLDDRCDEVIADHAHLREVAAVGADAYALVGNAMISLANRFGRQ